MSCRGRTVRARARFLELLSACAHEFGISQGVGEQIAAMPLMSLMTLSWQSGFRPPRCRPPWLVRRRTGRIGRSARAEEAFMAPPVPSWPEALPTLVTLQISVVPPWRSCGSDPASLDSIARNDPRHSNRSNWLISGSRITLTQHSQKKRWSFRPSRTLYEEWHEIPRQYRGTRWGLA